MLFCFNILKRYDYYNNECLIPENFFTEEDRKKIQSGDFRDECEEEEQERVSFSYIYIIMPPIG